MLSFSRCCHTGPKKNRKSAKYKSLTTAGGSPDEKIFTPTDERGFLPYTPHPAPRCRGGWGGYTLPPGKTFLANPSYSPAIAPRAIDAIACSVARGR
ncbi:hypothetical protein B5D77_20070 [Microcystis sp. MC19]|nr:hypothetical protein B5D77_20070 [Microcystis sp. MC19]